MNMDYYGKNTTLLGPWGGQEGSYWDDGVYSTVRQIEIAHGSSIDSIRVEYDLNGSPIWSPIHGGNGGTKIDKIRLEYPDEYLTSVYGYYGSLQEWGPVFVRSLTFETNRRIYGPLGLQEGTRFTCPKMHGKIVGFLGKSGWYLDAIGMYVEPLHQSIASHPVHRSQQYVSHSPQKLEYSMIQGSLGTNYDLIVAVRQKDHPQHDHQRLNSSPPISSSHDFKKTVQFHDPKNHEDYVPSKMESKIERVHSMNPTGVVTSGPWGGNGGTLFDDGVYDGVRQINLSRNVCIVSIRVCYDKMGQPVWGTKNGGTGSFKSDKIVFNYPSEILTHLTGYYGPPMIVGPNVIKSLTFHTTKGIYGPYGEEQGEFFTTKLKEGSIIVGFHGKKGLFVDAIGVHVLEGKLNGPVSSVLGGISKPNNHSSPRKVEGSEWPFKIGMRGQSDEPSVSSVLGGKSKPNNHSSPRKAEGSEWPFKIGKSGQSDEVVHRLVKDPVSYGPGPWGGEGGRAWDDGVFTGIKQIILTITDAICCIEIEYDRNGQSVWSIKHGGSGGETANRVKLDYPNEMLTCISGYYGPIRKEQGLIKVVNSLTFHTSRRKCGPFGEELGTYFASGTTEGKVVGFHGRSSMYLDAIGVHMQHWLGTNRSSKPPLMKIFS